MAPGSAASGLTVRARPFIRCAVPLQKTHTAGALTTSVEATIRIVRDLLNRSVVNGAFAEMKRPFAGMNGR